MSLKTKLKTRKPEQVDLVFHLDRPLAAELEQARRREAVENEGAYSAGKSAEVKDLEKRVAESSVTIRVRSMPRDEYNALVLEHPARDGVDEVFDSSTFFEAAAKATAVEVTATGTVPILDEDWDDFIAGLTDGEYDRLAGAVVQVNRNLATVDIAPLG